MSLDSQSSSTPCKSSSLATSRGRKVQRDNSLFPLEGKCRAAAKGCTRQSVEMIRKGCPDRQTAACLGGVSFEALAVRHPRATTWPSPPRWEACHLILSRLRLPANQVPLPPQGGARFSGTIPCFPLRGNAALAAKGCTRPRVEKKRKGSPDRQTAACLGECHLRLLRYSTPAPLCGPLPLKGAQGSEVFFPRAKSQPVLQDAVNIFLYLNEMKGNVTIGVANHKNS